MYIYMYIYWRATSVHGLTSMFCEKMHLGLFYNILGRSVTGVVKPLVLFNKNSKLLFFYNPRLPNVLATLIHSNRKKGF